MTGVMSNFSNVHSI